MNHPETNPNLILRLRDPADRAAWYEFVEIYRPVIKRMATFRGLQAADAEDLAQQVLLSVSKAIDRWEPDNERAKFRTWLRRIIRTRLIAHFTWKREKAHQAKTKTMSHSNPCNQRQIEAFLSDRLSLPDQAAFEDHLNGCDACCTALETMTADESWWQDASGYLDLHSSSYEPLSSTSKFGEGATTSKNDGLWLDFLGPTDDPRMLGRFGGHEIAGVVGYGGMGIVLKGFDPALNRFVAIKLLAPHFATSGAARKRFMREAQAAAAVVHDNVTAIHGVNEFNNLPYIVMPYIRGESLQKRLDRCGNLEIVEVLRIAMQMASGLAAAHAQGLVHRDIKPANILLPDGVERVLITDFGLARAADDASLTRSGVIAGTPQYMSPEQARGDQIDARSDLFSLGSVMYTMCTGRIPFRAETPYGILRRITDNEPRPVREQSPEIPVWLAGVIERLMQKSPDDRYQAAKDVASDLQQCLLHVHTPGSPLPPHIVARQRPRKTTLIATYTVLLIAAVASFLVTRRSPQNTSLDSAVPRQVQSTKSLSDVSWADGNSLELDAIQESIDQLLLDSKNNIFDNSSIWSQNK